jgi:hypothetical protein
VGEVGAGVVGAVGSAPPGLRRGALGWGSSVAEATRAARMAVASPKTKTSSLQGRRGVARCRGGGVGMVHRPGSAGSSGSCVCPCKPSPYRAHRVRLRTADRTVHSCRLVDVSPCIMLVIRGTWHGGPLDAVAGGGSRAGMARPVANRALLGVMRSGFPWAGSDGCRLACPGCGAGPGGGRQGHGVPPSSPCWSRLGSADDRQCRVDPPRGRCARGAATGGSMRAACGTRGRSTRQ